MPMRRPLRLLAVLFAAACGERAPGAPATATVGEPVPAYAAPTLAGDTLSLADLRGEVVLVNVWATWCPPCRAEMPSLERLYRQLGPRGLRVVAVSVDNRAAADAVVAFVEEYGISFTILHDPDDRVGAVFRNIGVPETYLVDREGRLVRRWRGAVDGDSPEFRAAVTELL